MAVDPEMLKRIMGAPDSVTAKLVALRKTPPASGELETGVWYSNFTRVKSEADRRGIPFYGMWTNGDLCGFCRRFTANILEPYFIDRMKTSESLFWLGGSMDDNDEDKRGGIGFDWCRGPDKEVSYFPFFSVALSKDGHDICSFYGSGHDFDQRKTGVDGAKAICDKIAEILSKDEPNQKPVNADTAKPAAAAAPVALNTVLHIRFNPDWDAAHIAKFQDSLKRNGGHCPCQKDKTKDTMCMCKAFLEKNSEGPCHCGAFEKYAV